KRHILIPMNGYRGRFTVALTSTLIALSATPLYALSAPDKLPGNPVHGKTLYQACMGCHSLDEDDVVPRHRGVVGRVAGTVPGYAYSRALKSSHIVWDRDSLDRWLTSPQALVPGAKMFFAMPNPQDRADVIAYLAEQR